MEKPISENQQELVNEIWYVVGHYLIEGKLNIIEVVGVLDLLKDAYPNQLPLTVTKPKEIHNAE